jgi:hypothetical protein
MKTGREKKEEEEERGTGIREGNKQFIISY